jgi:DNA recombination protein RmuC
LSVEALILLAAAAVIVALLLVLLLRRPVPDVALAARLDGLAAAQERQAERLAEVSGTVRAELADAQRVVSGFGTEQGRLLLEQAAAQRQRLDAIEKALLERLAADAERTQARLTEEAAKSRAEQDTARAGIAEQLAKHREAMDAAEKALLARLGADAERTQARLTEEAEKSRTTLDAKLREMREANDKRLADIQKSVNEQLGAAVEKQMTESFARVIDQFTAIQAMMGNVQSVASQVGDLKRLFSNVKTRGGWGEAQVKALLDDFLPVGSYEQNAKLREDSNELVEFAILMPVEGERRARLPLDAKFPVEDYERILAAHDAGELEGEQAARRALETRIRGEAAKISSKYISPPATTDFAVMYLPTEGLYAEVARIPGLLDDVAKNQRVFVAGPSLLPAMLRTIQLGHVTLALSKNAEGVRELLAATLSEMGKMDEVLGRLGKQVGSVSNTIGAAQTRTRAIRRKLRGIEALPADAAERLLEIDAEPDDEEAP